MMTKRMCSLLVITLNAMLAMPTVRAEDFAVVAAQMHRSPDALTTVGSILEGDRSNLQRIRRTLWQLRSLTSCRRNPRNPRRTQDVALPQATGGPLEQRHRGCSPFISYIRRCPATAEQAWPSLRRPSQPRLWD